MLSDNFSREEFACNCGCGFDTVDAELLDVLKAVRWKFGARPVIISSGCRCKKYNKKAGGSENSQHCYGRAADFTVQGVEPERVANWLESQYPEKYGIGRYKNWTHIDTRTGPAARWNG